MGVSRVFGSRIKTSRAPVNIDLERMTLKNVSRDELVELCALQYYLLLERASGQGVARREGSGFGRPRASHFNEIPVSWLPSAF